MYKLLSFLFFNIIFLLSCNSVAINNNHPSKDKLSSFFDECSSVLQQASNIISEKQLIKTLNHLNKMDNGGNKYYLLEKEDLNKMINNLSKISFDDCFIVNEKEVIIYSMFNNDFLDKHISYYPTSHLETLYKIAKEGKSSVADVSIFPPNGTRKELLFATPIKNGEKTIGVLIAAISPQVLSETIGKNFFIIDKDGIYKAHSNYNLILSSYNKKTPPFVKNEAFTLGKNTFYSFSYKSLEWFLVTDFF